MDLVERVAKAIAAVDPDQEGLTYDPRLYGGLARAAIAEVLDAMGDPSEGMMESGQDGKTIIMDYSIRKIWQAMLAQFRKESGL